jgi:hypothetical protein
MKYNLEIKNNGALPIPYVDKVGDQIAVSALYKDHPIYRDAIFIGATGNSQILVHCTTTDFIVEPHPDLEMVFKSNESTQKSISASH